METKKEFKYFTIFNHQKEEEYFRRKHKEGWKFVKVTGFGIYHFERCEPQDVIYKLDFPQKESDMEGYIKMFEDCGWEYIQEYVGYSYFRKKASERTENEDIFSDDPSRAAMMVRVYKTRLVPLLFILLLCEIPQFILSLSRGRYEWTILFGAILLVYLIFFAICGINYLKLKRK